MLTPDQFDTDNALPQFSIAVENLHLCGVDIGPATIPVTYNASWNPVFHLGGFAPKAKDFFQDPFSSDAQASFRLPSKVMDEAKACFRLPNSTATIELTFFQFQYGSGLDDITLDCRLLEDPLNISPPRRVSGFDAVLLSPPNFLTKTICLNESDHLRFELRPFLTKGPDAYGLSAIGDMQPVDLLGSLSNLREFLTFVKGSHSGLGHVCTPPTANQQDLLLLGFLPNDPNPFGNPNKRTINWFGYAVLGALPELYSGFVAAMADPKTKQALRQTIGFYRASTMARDTSIEMAIIAAHTALEAIVNYILEHQAGWSATLMSNRSIPFADKMRAAATYCRLHGDILEKNTELATLARSRNNADGFQIISFIRNKLVHQDPKYTPAGIDLHETWLVAMWLVEVLIFHLIGYRGNMIDRRIYSGYRGQTCQVPLR